MGIYSKTVSQTVLAHSAPTLKAFYDSIKYCEVIPNIGWDGRGRWIRTTDPRHWRCATRLRYTPTKELKKYGAGDRTRTCDHKPEGLDSTDWGYTCTVVNHFTVFDIATYLPFIFPIHHFSLNRTRLKINLFLPLSNKSFVSWNRRKKLFFHTNPYLYG